MPHIKNMRCAACDKMVTKTESVLVIDGQELTRPTSVEIGRECYRQVRKADKRGENWVSPNGLELACIGSNG